MWSTTRERSKIFGVSLRRLLLLEENEDIPYLMREVCAFLLEHGVHCCGIFRISGNSRMVEEVKFALERWGPSILRNYKEQSEIHAVATVLKHFIRNIPGGLVPKKTTDELINIVKKYANEATLVSEISCCLCHLSKERLDLLAFLCQFLATVAENAAENLMSPQSLGIVFGPCVFRFHNSIQNVHLQHRANKLMELLIRYYRTLFHDHTIDQSSARKYPSMSFLTQVSTLPLTVAHISMSFLPDVKTVSERQTPDSARFRDTMKGAVMGFADYLTSCSEEMASQNNAVFLKERRVTSESIYGSSGSSSSTTSFHSLEIPNPDSRSGLQIHSAYERKDCSKSNRESTTLEESKKRTHFSITGANLPKFHRQSDSMYLSVESVLSIAAASTEPLECQIAPECSCGLLRVDDRISCPPDVFLKLLFMVLCERRQWCCRPNRLSLMTKEQLHDELLDLQIGIDFFEHVYGRSRRTDSKFHSSPLFCRYRLVKHLLRQILRAVNKVHIRSSLWRHTFMFKCNSTPELILTHQ